MQSDIGIQVRCLRQPLAKAIATAAKLGASCVGIDARVDIKPKELSQTGLRQLRRTLEEHRLKVSVVEFRTRRGYDTLEDLDARVEATKNAMQFAYSLGAKFLLNQVGQFAENSEGQSWELLREVLRDLGNFGHHCGVMLATTTGGEDAAALRYLLDALPSGTLGIDLNPGGLIANGLSPMEVIAEVGGDISHVWANDAVRDLARGRGLSAQLGRGSVDYPALLGALEEYPYRGKFTIVRDDSPNPEIEFGEAVQFLQSVNR